MDFMLGQQGGIKKAPTMAKNQISAANQSLSMGMQGLQGLQQNKFNFAPIAQQARTQFNTQTVPGLVERFTSMGPQGSQGGQRSSAFAGTLGAAGAGLEESLAALKEQFGLKEREMDQSLYQNMFNQGMQPQFQNFQQEGSQGFLQSTLLPMLMAGATGGASGGMSGIMGLAQLLPQLFGQKAAPQGGGQNQNPGAGSFGGRYSQFPMGGY